MTHPPQQHLDELQVRPRYHVEGQTSTVGERWFIWDNVEGHFARFQNIADAGDAYNLCKTLNDAHQEIQRLRAALTEARRVIQEERDCTVECATAPPAHDLATCDPLTRPYVDEYDAVLAKIDAALSSQENKDDR